MKFLRDLKNLLQAFSPFFKGNYVYLWSFAAALVGVKVILALTKPYTFSPGTTISSAEMNANFDTLYNEVTNDRIGAKIILPTGNTSITQMTNSALTGTLVHNPNNAFNATTGIFIAPVSGEYLIKAFTPTDAPTVAELNVRAFINNNTTISKVFSAFAFNSTTNAHQVDYVVNSSSVYLNSGDNIHFRLQNDNSSTPFNFVNPGTPPAYVSIYKVNP